MKYGANQNSLYIVRINMNMLQRFMFRITCRRRLDHCVPN
uniref:Uncharacterized protein n=1 Tax=Anguilla anguilla TaxID=7936 RepID=A0A0E9SA33_ANGAN